MESKKKVDVDNLNEEKILFEWECPERAFKKRERDFWITAVAILVLVGVIFIFIKEFFLVIALGSILFMYYGLATVPPSNIRYKITNRGIYFGQMPYYWNQLERFWFKPSLSMDMVHFGTTLKFPQTVSFVILPKDKEKIKEVVIKRLPLVENTPNFVENVTTWFAKRLPLEDREKKA